MGLSKVELARVVQCVVYSDSDFLLANWNSLGVEFHSNSNGVNQQPLVQQIDESKASINHMTLC
jgi:hypothetical protein